MTSNGETVGILYPGEMGVALSKLLRGQGVSVVTVVSGRSNRTDRLAADAGLEVMPSLSSLAERATLVLSTVTPSAALDVARGYLAALPKAPQRRIFVDLNSISPRTVQQLDALFAGSGVEFVDGAIHGLASRLPERGTVYLSGKSAGTVAGLLNGVLKVNVVSDAPGRASALKMLISGLNKGVSALFLEMSLAARKAGLYDELIAVYKEAYPGVMDIVERTLPSYPRHAGRRGEEMREVEQTLGDLGLRPCLIAATRELLEELGRLSLAARNPDREETGWLPAEVVAAAEENGLLRIASPF